MSNRHVLHEFMTGQTEKPADNLRRDIAISAAVALVLSATLFIRDPSGSSGPDLSAFPRRNEACCTLLFDRHYFKCALLRSRASFSP
jgi:hypothetical protein